jgi:hypothetical protein
MLHTGLTGGLTGLSYCSCPVSSSALHAFVQGELHWFKGSLHVCRGSSLWFFELWFGGLRSLLEHSFVSDVSSCCTCLRGLRLAFVWLSIACWSFFLFVFSVVLLFVGIVNALIKGEIEDHVWFEDRWMVASWCDE